MSDMKRCRWVNLSDEIMVKYHDEEWGKPLKDEQKLYELFTLELFQAGLAWSIVLHKREAFRQAYQQFDIQTVANYTEEDINRLLEYPGIIHSKSKIVASISNSKIIQEIQKEYGSFVEYIWHFTDGKSIRIDPHVTRNELSDEISDDLKKRGMKYAGSVTIYSFLQACGVIQSHDEECVFHSSCQ